MSTRKANKERTRHKLVQATLKILHKQGPTALTTGRIAQAAGVAQPTFYVHFKDMDEALEEAAITVGDALRARLREFRDGLQDGASPQAATRHAFATGVEALTADRRSAELFLRHRRDVANPLGRRWRELMDGAREDLIADLHARGVGKHVDDLVVLADTIIGLVLTTVESILDGRVTNRASAMDMMMRSVEASMTPPVQNASLGASAA
ncbi:MAG: TetR/AcrR family transcriptional regulator [Sandaracinaceae bacterium]|mgnify:CR=1 FL=1|jgi:AcrR family transcriptional regulator|nr:TetR/AcrR family transcriptional regulator [Sandaracinaceae bacterium]MBP7681101.1 TetR/AcrR family transcriptional regulator [Deltaproteobacteria bacterium]MBK6813377.1 TetR/AcrR family transcriptional regulator [Sandaracinaceae bacterium]MBK7153039.1 TetR/AcrR family transcriptional regulator [Sandaracinaceae bacterium]MBK7773520.1 TetR/AcrR family transcriptional regulator [Sandaracinaceae bacterium]